MEASDRKEVWRRTATTLVQDLTLIVQYRLTFERFDQIARQKEAVAQSLFRQYVRAWYGDSLTAILRRQSDADERYDSLRALLADMHTRGDAYSRKSLNALFAEFQDRQLTEGYFNDFITEENYREFADSSGHALDTEKIGRDIAKLEDISWDVRHVIERMLGNRERRGLESDGGSALVHLYSIVDCFEEVAKRYVALLTGTSFVYQRSADELKWTEIFTFPWVAPDDE
ncbi:MAG: hypothetical protein M3Z14_01310 [Candidatus Eremiobacteraeota bacterium]|nr:hypothetical protein [Candidatus Eremiobacteraeota bacterium]